MNSYKELFTSTIVIVYFWYCAYTYTEWHFIDNANLIFHEAGHTIFSFFGLFVKIAAGSGFQFLLPLAISAYFFYKKQRISGSLTLLWAGYNLLNISLYARDAVAMQMDLLGGDYVIHDWNFILTSLNLLSFTPLVANLIYALGLFIIIVSSGLALYYSYKVDSNKDRHTFWDSEAEDVEKVIVK